MHVFLVFITLSIQVLINGSAALPVWAIPLELQESRPGPAAEHFGKGLSLLKKGDGIGAEAAFRKSLDLGPDHIGALVGLTEALLHQGRRQEARKPIQLALALKPNNEALHRSWGRFLVSQKEYAKAEEAFLKAAQLNPKGAAAHIELGNLYLGGLHRSTQAARSFALAIKLDPNDANAHFGLGATYSLMNKPKQALGELDEAARLTPNNPLIQMALGNLHRDQKEWDNALAAYTAAAKLDSRFVDAVMAKGDTFSSMGKWQEAKREYDNVIKVDPGHAHAYNNLAWISAEQNDQLDDALTWAKKAVSLAPATVQFTDTLAWVHRAKGDLNQASQILETALLGTPNNATMTYHLGIVLAEQGKVSEALETFKKSLKLNLDEGSANDAKRRIHGLTSSRTAHQ